MRKLKNIVPVLLLMSALVACQSGDKQLSDDDDMIEMPATEEIYRVDTTLQHDSTRRIWPIEDVKVMKSIKGGYSTQGGRYDYAEKKTSNELEEEYYDVFGDKYLDNIDDEEYDAAEEYDYE